VALPRCSAPARPPLSVDAVADAADVFRAPFAAVMSATWLRHESCSGTGTSEPLVRARRKTMLQDTSQRDILINRAAEQRRLRRWPSCGRGCPHLGIRVLGRLLAAVVVSVATPGMAAEPDGASWRVAPARSVSEREIHFTSGDAAMVGTLTVPSGAGGSSRYPVVVVTHAASAPTRKYALYRHLMQSLPGLGYGVFVYDRRGSGASTGDRSTADYGILAGDAIAAARRLASEADVDARQIGYWGLSQGGWLAVLAAEGDATAAFAISVSAALTTPAEQMRFAMSNLLDAHGYSKSDVAEQARTRALLDGYYIDGTVSRETAQKGLDAMADKKWFKESFLPRSVEAVPSQSLWRRELGYDPVAPLEALNVPVLLIFGDSDPWIPVQRSLQVLPAISRAHRNITFRVVPNAGHAMDLAGHESMATDDAHNLQMAPEAQDYFLLLGWWLGSLAHVPPH
jgi:pimeloyl-ACP methyl ester carboxylesterase